MQNQKVTTMNTTRATDQSRHGRMKRLKHGDHPNSRIPMFHPSTLPRSFLACALVGALALVTNVAQPGEIGHFNGGFMNIRDYFVPEPGFYGAVYNFYYTTDRLNDRNGNKISSVTINPGPGPGVTLGVNVDVNMYVLAPTLIYVTDIKALGIKYGALITPTFANLGLDSALSTATRRGGKVEA